MNLADMFSVTTLTASVNKLPTVYGLLGSMGLFNETGILTTTVIVEERMGQLVLIENTSRDGDPKPTKKDDRKRRNFSTMHLPVSGKLSPSDLQNIAPFGSDTVENQQARIINDKLQSLKDSCEVTREFHRVGAVKGVILDADGSVIYDLYDEFGVTKKAIPIPFSTATTDVRKYCLDAKRHAEKKLQGQFVTKFKSICGSDFFDALTGHKNVQAAYSSYQAAQDRIGGDMRSGFTYGGIEYIEYNASVGNVNFVDPGKAHVFPVGGRDVFIMRNAPANYNETVNTLGLPFYAKAKERDFNKGWDMEAQANPLALCMFPEALVELSIQ